MDREMGSNEIFGMLDKIGSETESDIEYIAEELISDNKEQSHELLTPDATVQ